MHPVPRDDIIPLRANDIIIFLIQGDFITGQTPNRQRKRDVVRGNDYILHGWQI